MTWLGFVQRTRDERLRLIAREAALAAQLALVETDLARARSEAADLRGKIERLLDNALYGAGVGPIFAPDDARFRTRGPEEQTDLTRLQQPVSNVEWRRRAEQETRELARQEDRRKWQRDIEQICQQTNPRTVPGPANRSL